MADTDNKYPFPDQYQEFIFYRTYSRWDYDKNRRQTWDETVDRYFDFMLSRVSKKSHNKYLKCKEYVQDRRVLPSMRALWTAGPALERDHIAAYNCAYAAIDRVRVFAEIMYILMCGAGAGFSVERQNTNKLPEVPSELVPTSDVIKFKDSKIGWCEGFDAFLSALYKGMIYNCDFSKIRPEGAVLKTFGGRASGPRPLIRLIEYTTNLFKGSLGRKLTSIECYDLVCIIGSVVVSGGVRRSATLSLSNLSDNRMKHAKDGQFWMTHPHRQLSNNSVAYTEKPDMTIFMEEWLHLATSGTGERGIFNRESARKIVERIGRRDPEYEWGCNPCSEIILRPDQFCNLTEVVIDPKDDLHEVCEKVKAATVMGCVQATLTDFNFLGKRWKKNCEEERLLGVSLTGVCDHPILSGRKGMERLRDWLENMRTTAQKEAHKWAGLLNINVPTAITAVKPSGTVSQLVNCASGIHPRYSHYYIRRVRVSKTDPLGQMLIDKGVPYHPEVGQTLDNCTTLVFDFPVKSPRYSVFRNAKKALDQLEFWKAYQLHWCEHKPSITVYVGDNEWLEVGAWVYKNWDIVSGIAFLPRDDSHHELQPYEEITKKEYERRYWDMPRLNFTELTNYESSDYTEGAKEVACQGGACEI